MSTSVPISGLNDISTIKSTDFLPIVKSGSALILTTFRVSINEFNNWFAASGSCSSSSFASSSISASWAAFTSLALSASYAKTSSVSFLSTSASFANKSVSSSFANISISSSFASTTITSSYALSSSQASTASYVVSASFASTTISASYAGTTSVVISASYAGSSSFAGTASYASNSSTASFISSGGGASGIVFLDVPVVIGAAPATSTDPYLSWIQVIRPDQVTKPSFVSGTSVAGDTYINADPTFSAGPRTFHTWTGTGGSPNNTHIPSTAKAVILDAIIRTTWTDGSGGAPSVILVRKNASTSWLPLTAVTNGTGGRGEQTAFGQGMYPIDTTDGTFSWIKTSNDNVVYGWMVRIIGYIT